MVLDVPLSFMYLSSFLKKKMKRAVDVKLLDLRLHKDNGQILEHTILEFKPNLIGISLLSMDKGFLEKWGRFINALSPEALLIAGGAGAAYEYNEILPSNKALYAVVIGEGEKVLLNIVESLIAKKSIKDIKGIAYYNGLEVVVNQREDFIENLDDLPFPDYSLVDIKRYCGFTTTMNNLFMHKRYTHIVSSRGCPYRCIYCHELFGKRTRKRSPENFLSEIKWLYNHYSIREFHIVDDIFNLDRSRMHKILNMIIDSKLNVKLAFPNGLRGDILEKEDLDLLKQAGAYMITVAIETATERWQEILGKKLDIQKTLDNIDYAHKIGIITKGFFMIGFPGETVQEIENTVAMAIKSNLDHASFFIVIPFHNTGLERLAYEQWPEMNASINQCMSDNYYYGKKNFYSMATGYDLKKMQRRAYIKFYFPSRLIKFLIKSPARYSILIWGFSIIQVLFGNTGNDIKQQKECEKK